MSHFNNVNVGVTGFVFDSRYTFTGLGYLAVCWQKQWGNLWAGYTEVLNWYFPLTTSQVYAVCLTKHTKNISSGHNWEPARIEEWNNSYARIHPDGDLGYSVIAICKAQQQWGFTNNTGRPYITFPFKFSNVFTAISCICHNGSPSEANTVYNVSISGMNIGASGGGSGKYWCAFGVAQQQWGTNRTNGIYSFPIPFTEALCCFGGGEAGSGYYDNASAYSNTQVRVYSDGSSRFVSWIAIGA